jgi:hypothetical protein
MNGYILFCHRLLSSARSIYSLIGPEDGSTSFFMRLSEVLRIDEDFRDVALNLECFCSDSVSNLR